MDADGERDEETDEGIYSARDCQQTQLLESRSIQASSISKDTRYTYDERHGDAVYRGLDPQDQSDGNSRGRQGDEGEKKKRRGERRERERRRLRRRCRILVFESGKKKEEGANHMGPNREGIVDGDCSVRKVLCDI